MASKECKVYNIHVVNIKSRVISVISTSTTSPIKAMNNAISKGDLKKEEVRILRAATAEEDLKKAIEKKCHIEDICLDKVDLALQSRPPKTEVGIRNSQKFNKIKELIRDGNT